MHDLWALDAQGFVIVDDVSTVYIHEVNSVLLKWFSFYRVMYVVHVIVITFLIIYEVSKILDPVIVVVISTIYGCEVQSTQLQWPIFFSYPIYVYVSVSPTSHTCYHRQLLAGVIVYLNSNFILLYLQRIVMFAERVV